MEPVWGAGNALMDVACNVNAGIIVVLASKDKVFCYHKCSNQYIVPSESVVFVDMNKRPDLLEEGEWPTFLEQSDIKECTCNMKGIVLRGTKVGKTTFARYGS